MVTWLTAVVAEEAHKKKRKGFWSDFLISMSEATDVVNYHELAQAIVQEAYAMLENWEATKIVLNGLHGFANG